MCWQIEIAENYDAQMYFEKMQLFPPKKNAMIVISIQFFDMKELFCVKSWN